MHFDANLAITHCEAVSAEQAITLLCERMVAQGMVSDAYAKAVVKREKEYPTGIPTATYDVAIPHAPSDYVLKPGLAVAQLKAPVRFYSMGDREEALRVRVVFLLAVKDPKAQLNMLQSLMGAFENEQAMCALRDAATPQEMVDVLKGLGLAAEKEE